MRQEFKLHEERKYARIGHASFHLDIHGVSLDSKLMQAPADTLNAAVK